MHITKRGNKWTAVINMESVDGQRKQKRITQKPGETKKQFEDRGHDIELRVHRGEFIEVTDLTVREYLEKWMEHKDHQVAPKTKKNYQYMIDNYINKSIGKKQLAKLQPLDIEALYRKLQDKPDTAIYCHRVLRAALKRAIKWKMLKYNPIDGVDAPTKEKKEDIAVWDSQTMGQFAMNADDEILLLPSLIAAYTGMRRGEICGLTWDDINYKKKCIYIRKQLQRIESKLQLTKVKTHRSNRPIAISDELISTLEQYHKIQLVNAEFFEDEYVTKILSGLGKEIGEVDNNLVCRWQDGRPVDPDYLSKNFPKVAVKLGLPRINFHALRHSHATELIKSKIDMFIISRRLGHTNISTTSDIYGHVDVEMQKEAADVIKLPKKAVDNS